MFSGIYQIRNIINNKVYIGSSKNLGKRELDHFSALERGNHHNTYLQRAWNKYGRDVFKFDIIRECKEENLLKIEQFYLDKYKYNKKNILYNTSLIAGRVEMNEETRKKISKSNKICYSSKEQKLRMSNLHKNKIVSKETREKISKVQKGRKHLEDTKYRIGVSLKGRKFSQEIKDRMSSGRKGMKFSEEHCRNISKAKKGQLFGENHPMYGKHHTEEAKEKISKARIGKKVKPRSKETKERISKAMIGKKYSLERRRNISEALKLSVKNKGKFAPSAKHYIFYSPCGIRYDVIGNLTGFCKEQNLSVSMIYKIVNNKKKNNYKGWKIFKYKDE
jgi:group I intron endonuclease